MLKERIRTEDVGFEPTIGSNTYNSLAVSRFKPLSQSSVCVVELPTNELIKCDVIRSDGFKLELFGLQFLKHVHHGLVMLG